LAPIQIERLAISRQSSLMTSAVNRANASAMACPLSLAGKLLLSIDDGLNVHQTHENAAEAACIGIAEEFCDIGQGLARTREESARDVQANLCKHRAVAGAHAAEMTLQRPRTDLAYPGRTI
jgi:hypothetical protein